jgi:hypothetical protein
VRWYALIFGVFSVMPCAARGLAKALTRQPTSFLPYAVRLASFNGGFGERTLTLQDTWVPPRWTA